MRLDKGKPSGVNKNTEGTGVPTGKHNDDLQRDQELTDKYTDDEQGIAESVRTNNPNRTADKQGGNDSQG